MKIDFSPPDMTQLEIEGAIDAIRSGWITTGPKTKELESEISEYCHTLKVACLNSQTACGEIALRLLGIGKENGGSELDEVIVPAYTYTATASIVCHIGAKLVFVDSQVDSLEMDYERLEALINEHTKAVIPVDLAGIPCDYERIREILERKAYLFQPKNELQRLIGRVAISADAAHSFGASLKGRRVGEIADFTSFSFHAVKNLTTAEGGALTWNIAGADNEAIYQKVMLYSLHGQSKDALAKTQLGAWEYDIIEPWYKCNMTDIVAGIGLAQLKRYPELLKRRKEIIQVYDQAFQPMGIEVLDHYTDIYESSGHLYITRIPKIDTQKRQEIITQMAAAGVATNVHYKPLPMMTAYQKRGFDIKDFPHAYAHFENEITLPLHTRLTDEQVAYVIEQYTQIVKKYL